MTFKKLKTHGFDLHRSYISEAFWRGIIDGFSPQKFLLSECRAHRLLGKDDSVYQAWVEVGDLLTHSLDEYGDGEATKATPPKSAAERRANLIHAH